MDYGTGAIFGCPAHDQRDLEFAREKALPVIPVVLPPATDAGSFAIGDEAYTGDGTMINSGFLDGLCRRGGQEEDRRTPRSRRTSRANGAGSVRPSIACATGASRGSAIGAARSR